MTVTTGLSAVEALTKAKVYPGSYAVYGRENNRWYYDSMFEGLTGLFYYEEMIDGEWVKRDVLEGDISPEWIVELTWEHHLTSDTL